MSSETSNIKMKELLELPKNKLLKKIKFMEIICQNPITIFIYKNQKRSMVKLI